MRLRRSQVLALVAALMAILTSLVFALTTSLDRVSFLWLCALMACPLVVAARPVLPVAIAALVVMAALTLLSIASVGLFFVPAVLCLGLALSVVRREQLGLA